MRKLAKPTLAAVIVAILLAVMGIAFFGPDSKSVLLISNLTPETVDITQDHFVDFKAHVIHGSAITNLTMTFTQTIGVQDPCEISEAMDSVGIMDWQYRKDCVCLKKVDYYYEAQYEKKFLGIFPSNETTRFPNEGNFSCNIINTATEVPTAVWVTVFKEEDFLVRLHARFTNSIPCVEVDDNLVKWEFEEGTEYWTFTNDISTGKTVYITSPSDQADVWNLKMKVTYNDGEPRQCFYVFKHSVDSSGELYYPELIDCIAFDHGY